jgi:rhodanese-related sulfurtransferase
MPLSDLSNPDVLLRENWQARKRIGSTGTPYLPASFVAGVGARVWIIDVRDDAGLTGPQGHIPGVWRVPLARIGRIVECLPGHTPVILVCEDGARSRTAAEYLLALGMTTVATLEGGMVQWRNEGYSVSRDASVLSHELEPPAPGHGSDGRLLRFDRSPGKRHLTREMITEHVGDVAKVRRVKLAAFLLANQTSCVDGREDRAIIGTPGGDAGEFLLGLSAAEDVANDSLDLDHVPALTRAFSDTFGGIYLHTDNHALNRLARSLRSDPRIEPAIASLNTIDQWERFLRRPPPALQKALLEHLVQPDHVGCGHLKLALTHPDVHRIRPSLITRFFETFYQGLWNGARDLHWVVLGGDHAEGAVVNVTLEDELWPFSVVPLIAPSIGGVQMFVNHPQVVAYLRDQTARFLTGTVGHLLPVSARNADRLAEAIPRLGAQQAGATLRALAAGLPVFGVHFDSSGRFEVTSHDAIAAA